MLLITLVEQTSGTELKRFRFKAAVSPRPWSQSVACPVCTSGTAGQMSVLFAARQDLVKVEGSFPSLGTLVEVEEEEVAAVHVRLGSAGMTSALSRHCFRSRRTWNVAAPARCSAASGGRSAVEKSK